MDSATSAKRARLQPPEAGAVCVLTMLRHAGRAVRRSQGVVGRGQVSTAEAAAAPAAALERHPAPEAGQDGARQPRWLAELGVVRNDWTCVARLWCSLLGLPGGVESLHWPSRTAPPAAFRPLHVPKHAERCHTRPGADSPPLVGCAPRGVPAAVCPCSTQSPRGPTSV